jgi:hypothetical protein
MMRDKTTVNNGLNAPDTELIALRRATERVTNGLRQMLDVQATHTVLLRAILDAATAPIEPDQEPTQTLALMLLALREQSKILAQINAAMIEPVSTIETE